MKKEIIIIGDVEMGGGTLTDDFIADKQLSQSIIDFSQRDHPIDLIFNGDTFDFLKCPSEVKPKTFYPRHITKDVSLAKLKLIYKAHKNVFQALQVFTSSKDKHVFFIVGNHDEDLAYSEVKEEIKRLISNKDQIHFPGIKYHDHDVYVEHGHQYDFIFMMNYDRLFLEYKGQTVINLPFVTFGLISTVMHMKEAHPFLERIYPRPAILTHHRIIAKKLNRNTLGYFIKSILYYPFRFYSDPTYTFPTNLFLGLYKRLSTAHWEVDDITTIFQNKAKWDKYKIYVLGHIHEKRIEKGRNQVIIHPGSWRDEYDFQSKTRELIPRIKRYVDIMVEEKGSHYTLVDIPQYRSIIDFDEVLKDEMKFHALAVKEEEYVPPRYN